jgi:hypothetical protein
MSNYVAKRISIEDATIDGEVWKDVCGYEGQYKVSNLGRIYGEASKRLLNPTVHKTGYCLIPFGKRNERKSFRIHRVVAEAFIPNPYNKKEVNHKDKNKENNAVENLEWNTPMENTMHKLGTGSYWNNWQGKINQANHSVAKHKMEGFSELIIPMLKKLVPLNP